MKRFATLCAAAALGLGGLVLASPALAEPAPTETSPVSPLVAAAAAASAIEAAPLGSTSRAAAGGETEVPTEASADAPNVVGYGTNGEGEPLVLVNADLAAEASLLEDIAGEHGVDQIALIDAATIKSSTDVVGGAGFLMAPPWGSATGACSIGFTGFNGAGDAAIITAGHCANEGSYTNVFMSLPSEDKANGGPGMISSSSRVVGQFGFFRFGGADQGAGAKNDPASTDIAVIDVTDSRLTLLPEVTDWTTAVEDDLAASTTPIERVADPVSGELAKSGSTTGVTTGSTTVMLPYTDGSLQPTEILDGYIQVSGKWVHGFIGTAITETGDSGGAVFQGTTAVGLVSGGPAAPPARGDDWAWYTRLDDALEQVPGDYTVALDIKDPVVTTPAAGASVAPGGDIVVTVGSPAATELVWSVAGGKETVTPLVSGKATLKAPAEVGAHRYAFTARGGFNTSARVTATITVAVPAPPVVEPPVTVPPAEVPLPDGSEFDGSGAWGSGGEASWAGTGAGLVAQGGAASATASAADAAAKTAEKKAKKPAKNSTNPTTPKPDGAKKQGDNAAQAADGHAKTEQPSPAAGVLETAGALFTPIVFGAVGVIAIVAALIVLLARRSRRL